MSFRASTSTFVLAALLAILFVHQVCAESTTDKINDGLDTAVNATASGLDTAADAVSGAAESAGDAINSLVSAGHAASSTAVAIGAALVGLFV
jgi:hypothetical protein